MPSKLEIFIMKADGTEKKQLTSNGAANFAPYFHPNGRQIIFASNINSKNPGIPNFDLFLVNRDGTGLEQVTFEETFDASDVFQRRQEDRLGSQPDETAAGNTNVFIADWVD
jgi:Tol biopolymer transport system component